MGSNFLSNQNLQKQVRGSEFNKATSSFLGTVRPDGTTILVDSSGTISVVPVTTATSSATGTVRPDNTSITVAGGVIAVSSSYVTLVTSSNGFGARTIQSTSAGVPTGGSDGDIVYQY